jgi:hypothetical protein
MRLAERVLDGEAGGLVDERERRVALLVLHLGAVPHVLVPVLHVRQTQIMNTRTQIDDRSIRRTEARKQLPGTRRGGWWARARRRRGAR